MLQSIKFSILLLFVSMSVVAQHSSVRIDSLLSSIHSENPEVSISVGLIQDGNISYFNLGDISRDENAVAVSENSIWEIASITKAVTGNLLAQAVLEGKIKLEDYIETYLPKSYILPTRARNTVRVSDLASHQSGLADIDFPALIAANPQQPTAQVTPGSLTEMINNSDSLVDYGQYRYSTMGFVLIGQMLEEVYGMSYESLYRQKIVDELSLINTKLSEFDTKELMHGYGPAGGEQEAFVWNCVASAGLVKASTSDMITYLNSILIGDSPIADGAKLQEMSFYQDERREIGLGINIIKIEETTLFAKTGDTMGQSSVMAYDRENNLGLVIFVNQQNGELRNKIFNEMYEVLYDSKE